MSPAETSSEIVPFWHRLRAVMLYPAHGSALAAIVLLGAAQVLRILPVGGGIIGLLATVAMYRYAFECLRSTSEGFMKPPEVGFGSDRDLGWRFVGLIFVFALMFVASEHWLGRGGAIAVAIVLAACTPAATMVLAIDQSLGQALNPLRWLAVIAGIGWPYLAMFGVCAAILMSEGYAEGFAARWLPLPVALIALGIIANYAITALFHLMGYVLYQYHEALGLEPVAAQPGPRRVVVVDPDQEKLDEAAAMVRDGKLAEAIDLLATQMRRGASAAVHGQYRKLLQAAGDDAGLLAHGRERIAVLIEQDDARAAVELLRQCQAIDPAFAPEAAVQVTTVAHMAAQQGQAQAALQVLDGFDDRFPGSQYRVVNGLLAADLLHEKLGRDPQARELLLALKAALPGDPLAAEIDARLARIERMIAATAIKSPPAQP